MAKRLLLSLILYIIIPLSCWYYGYTLYQDSVATLYNRSSSNGPYIPAEIPPLHSEDKGGIKDELGSDPDSIVTFIHATDIHISKYSRKGQYIHFLHFLSTVVPLVSPRFVAATGDLTDGKDEKKLGSLQQFEEWSAYKKALKRANLLDRNDGAFWFDQRGNHDCFNVPGWASPSNFYREYGVIKKHGYHFDIEEKFGKYSFIATDGCPDMGVGRPMNFFGYLDARAMDNLEKQLDQSKYSNHTIVLNHYPTSTMVYGKTSSGKSFNDLTDRVSLFLCGHLHLLKAGIGAQLQYYHPDRFLELELGDMKDHALYRIYAIDHDIISFADVKLPLAPIPYPNPQPHDEPPLGIEWVDPVPHPPIVLVTNPKDSRYNIPNREPLHRIGTSKYIRVLVWADKNIAHLHASIDGVPINQSAMYRGKNSTVSERWKETADGKKAYIPLWVIPWDPFKYNDGKEHTLVVEAKDVSGMVGSQVVHFRLDGKRISLDNAWRGGLIMSTHVKGLLKRLVLVNYITIFLVVFLMPKIVLLVHHLRGLVPSTLPQSLRLVTYTTVRASSPVDGAPDEEDNSEDSQTLWQSVSHFVAGLVLRLTTFSRKPSLYWPLYFYSLYIIVAPLFVGSLIPALGANGDGAVYIYGVHINQTWIPLGDTWAYALLAIPYPMGVIPLYLGCILTPTRYIYPPSSPYLNSPWYKHWLFRILIAGGYFYYMLIPTAMSLYVYGTKSIIFGVARAWMSVWVGCVLWFYDWRYGSKPGLSNQITYTPAPTPPQSARD
ncbi:hypothetical protein H4219_003250 [Mycoemilia scoparia]|uniref:Calcineurin-like phosphoesterase domain-containing protein n=1 Tax=Mycoemilia scoparia TaxID=417184 RepID=A0A9W8A0M7_9FUNG|nr:hypothetical protein H4219_003250 [Mycoemilia scoparia]